MRIYLCKSGNNADSYFLANTIMVEITRYLKDNMLFYFSSDCSISLLKAFVSFTVTMRDIIVAAVFPTDQRDWFPLTRLKKKT